MAPMAFTSWVRALCTCQHRARGAMRRCSSLRAVARRVVSLAGCRPVGDGPSSRCPTARRCCWSRSAQPCLAPRSRHRQAHPTAVFRVTWLQVGSLLIKLPLSIWFTFGGAGLPAQGAVGCAWATLVVNVSMLALALWLLRTQALYIPLRIWQRMEPPHWPTILGFARLGLPAGLAILVEVTSFTLMALFIARQGTVATAAHQIAANVAAVLYMVPLSLAIATSARVSYWLGAGNETQARSVVYMGFRLSALTGIALAAILLIANETLSALYSSSAAVVAITGGLLLWVAAYHAADAVQTLCVFVLRCYRITIAPLVVYCVLLWGAGLGGGYVLLLNCNNSRQYYDTCFALRGVSCHGLQSRCRVQQKSWASSSGWRAVEAAKCAWPSGRASFWPAFAASATTRLPARSGCGRTRLASGADVLLNTAWRGFAINPGPASQPSTAPRCATESWRSLSCRRQRVWRAGMAARWRRRWACPTMPCGARCARKASSCGATAPGASAPTPSSPPRPPT